VWRDGILAQAGGGGTDGVGSSVHPLQMRRHGLLGDTTMAMTVGRLP